MIRYTLICDRCERVIDDVTPTGASHWQSGEARMRAQKAEFSGQHLCRSCFETFLGAVTIYVNRERIRKEKEKDEREA